MRTLLIMAAAVTGIGSSILAHRAAGGHHGRLFSPVVLVGFSTVRTSSVPR